MSSFRIIELGRDEIALRIEGQHGSASISGILRLDVDEAEELTEVAGRLAELLRVRRGDRRPLGEQDAGLQPVRTHPPINANGF